MNYLWSLRRLSKALNILKRDQPSAELGFTTLPPKGDCLARYDCFCKVSMSVRLAQRVVRRVVSLMRQLVVTPPARQKKILGPSKKPLARALRHLCCRVSLGVS